jgi:hypothetical protein
MKFLQLIKNKFINKKAIANIKIIKEPGGNNGYKPLPEYNNNYNNGGGGSGIPFCGTCGTQCCINYVLKCNC